MLLPLSVLQLFSAAGYVENCLVEIMDRLNKSFSVENCVVNEGCSQSVGDYIESLF